MLERNLASHLVGAYFSATGDLYKWTLAERHYKLISDSTLTLSLQPPTSGLIRDRDTALYYGYGWIYTMVKNKRINFFKVGRGDWMGELPYIYMLETAFFALRKKIADVMTITVKIVTRFFAGSI